MNKIEDISVTHKNMPKQLTINYLRRSIQCVWRFNYPAGVFLLFSILFFLVSINAQQTATYVGGATPSGIARNHSPNSIESINMFNGSVNMAVPLLNFGGRGAVGYTIYKPVKMPQWTVNSTPINICGDETVCIIYNSFAQINRIGSEIEPGYEPGIIESRRIGTTWQESSNGIPGFFARTQTVLIFIKNDGSEQVLYDERLGGEAADFYNSGGYDSDRGRIFTAKDGSELTFIADETIYDWNNMQSIRLYESGYLKTKDGTISRVTNGHIDWMRDRNGNLMTFTYAIVDSGHPERRILTNVTDSSGRGLAFVYGTQYDQIYYTGTNGAVRVIQINYNTVGNRFLPSPTYTSGANLFPQMVQNGSTGAFAPLNERVVSTITLPNGQNFGFFYNEYGEIAKLEMPLGATIEYGYGAGDDAPYPSYPSGQVGNVCNTVCYPPIIYIYRRLKERREYANGGSVMSFKTTYNSENSSNIKVTETQIDPAGQNILSKTFHYYSSSPVASLALTAPHDSLPNYLEGRELKTENLDITNNAILTKTEYEWEAGCWGEKRVNCIYAGYNQWSPYLKSTTTSILEPATNQYKIAKTSFDFDQYNNPTDIYEFDFGTGAPGAFKRRTHTDFVSDTNYTSETGAHLRSLPSQIWVSADTNGATKASLTLFEYDNYNNDSNHSPLVSRTNVVGHETASYGTNKTIRGNATKVTSYGNAQNQTEAISAYSQYDVLGNVVKIIDAKGFVSTIIYNDNFGTADNEARINAPPTQLNGQSTFAFPTSGVNALGWIIGYTQFDYFTGQAVNIEDLNGVISKTIYNDLLDRPTQTVSAVNTSFEIQSNIIYDDANKRVESRSDLNVLNDNLLKSESFYDGLGRTLESRRYESDGNYIAAKSIPFVMVQDPETQIWRAATKVSNPYRPNAGEQPVWTTSLSHALGSKVITPDGAIVKTEFSGDTITVTDQAGKKRRSVTNALGQLIRVDEPNDAGQLDVNGVPTQPTNYAYDTLNNLTTVTQGVQTRTFVYDSLSRLKQATNPELGTTPTDGTIFYNYDNNGNLTQKTDSRQVVTNYVYDNLNRITNRNYSAPQNLPNYQATPNVTYTYDDVNIANSKGKLTKVSSSVSETKYTQFDIIGRLLASQQITDGQTYSSSYVYNLSGALIEQTYPSGRVVKNTLDQDGDLMQVQSRKANDTFRNYANSFNYTAAGAVSSMRLGNGRWENTQFNSRLQPTQIGLGTSATNQSLLKLDYEYGTLNLGTGQVIEGTNNGNIAKQTITVQNTAQAQGFTATQYYAYDSLNRIQIASENLTPNGGQMYNSWKQTFTYDRYGNRRFDTTNGNTTTLPTGCSETVCNPQIDPTTNKLIGYNFDNAGNTSVNAGGQTFIYDAENKQTKVQNGTTTIGEYFYDGDGKRIKKVVPNGETTIFVYDASGKMVAEYSTIVASPTEAKISYLTNDHLGSPRINTDATGQVIARHDYQPFGEEIQRASYSADTVRQKFTGYERDSESGLNFAQARYYNSNLGRFQSPDNFLNDTRVSDTQSWNLYVYARNNPIYLTDPEGEKVYVGYITDATEREEFLRRVNFTYGCENCVSVDNDGYLTVDTSGLSEEVIRATQFLTDAINSTDLSKLFTVEITNNNSDVAFGDSSTRRGVPIRRADGTIVNTSAVNIRLDFGDDVQLRSIYEEVRDSFLNLVFAHEISHFYPEFKQDPTVPGVRGPVDNPINEIRLARGLPLRSEYLARGISGLAFLSFGDAVRDPKFGFVIRGNDGIETENNKIIFWVQRLVKRQ